MTETTIAAFLAVSSFVALIGTLLARRSGTVEMRLEGMSDSGRSTTVNLPQGAKPSMLSLLLPTGEDARNELGKRLVQAGLYKSNSRTFFFISKMVLLAIPIGMGLAANSMGLISFKQGFLVGGISGAFGMILPSFWLDARRKKRQTEIRRALPDALDIIVVCVEGGLSLPGAISRVSQELRTAHRTLAAEMVIVQREIQLGRTTGEAMLRFADRFDLEELRSLSSVIQQAERFGASVVKALRVHAESLRLKRRQQAEERAQKAAVKLIFPTVVCIFPALFIVLVGPAVYRILEMFSRLGGK
jgi:tight adherence protein C